MKQNGRFIRFFMDAHASLPFGALIWSSENLGIIVFNLNIRNIYPIFQG